MLSTFNEIDMTNIMAMRSQYKDAFLEKHGVKLGFMSAFVKAAASALEMYPAVNAVIDEKEIIYRDYVDISIAVATPKGLVVPVLRDVDSLRFADVEKVRRRHLHAYMMRPCRRAFMPVRHHQMQHAAAACVMHTCQAVHWKQPDVRRMCRRW